MRGEVADGCSLVSPFVSWAKLAFSRRLRRAFTLIELLVVISIIGMLVGLMLPAVQASRESGRMAVCQNNLHQIGLALAVHDSTHGYFPSCGWSYVWVGEPERGSGKRQPGGWIYSLLPYLERKDLHGMARGTVGVPRLSALGAIQEYPLNIFHCPTRRGADLLPYDTNFPPRNGDVKPMVAKTDYAINGGDLIISSGRGPATLAAGDDPNYPWFDFSKVNGISHMRSQVARALIRDGSSHTYLVGEKYLHESGVDLGDDQSLYAGYDNDAARWVSLGMVPMQDGPATNDCGFGSAHSSGCQFAFVDGSVRRVNYAIDPEVHRRLGNRHDGLVIDDAQY